MWRNCNPYAPPAETENGVAAPLKTVSQVLKRLNIE